MHTVGSLVGALAGAATAKPPETDAPPTAIAGSNETRRVFSITKEYWLVVVLLATVAFPVVLLAGGVELEAGVMAVMYALVFPVIQLAASLVVLVTLLFSKRPGRRERLGHLWRISLRSFVGGMIGLLIMIPILAVL